MATMEDIQAWRGRTLVDRDGDKIGKIEDVYLDRSSGEPEWVAVKTGLFGSNVSFVPIHGADTAGDDLRVAYEKDRVKDAPNVDPDGELSPEEERRLYQHYGRGDYDEWTGDSEDRTEATYGSDTRDDMRGDHDTDGDDDTATVAGSGEASGRAGQDAMTRSQDELRVGTERRETGRARLRKYVETENVQQTVPVEREEVRVEREPFDSPGRGHEETGAAEPTETPEPARGDETPPGNR
jgi:stress response protein YsnF